LTAVELEIEDLPAADDLDATSPPLAPTLLGLYRGLPHGESAREATGDAGAAAARAVVLYRKNLARVAGDHDELARQIRATLRHELGHVRGLSEADLRRRGLE
jgi:predicted Zn-dependent protease with MMP-like domain